MLENLKNNPILIRQMRNARWPSPRTAMIIAALLTLSGTAVALIGFVLSPDGSKPLSMMGANIIFPIDSMLRLFGPWIAAVVAVVATVQAVDSQAYQMMRISNLSEGDIILGYVAATAYRMRALWMAVGGLLLPLMVAMTHSGVRAAIMFACSGPPDFSACTPPTFPELLFPQAGLVVISAAINVAAFITWHWFVITLGVWMAFRHRQIGKALVGTLIRWGIILAIQMVISWLAFLFVFTLSYDVAYSLSSERWLQIPVTLMFAVLYLVLGRANFRKAIRQIENESV